MILYKKIDLITQVIGVVIAIIWGLLNNKVIHLSIFGEPFLDSYFFVAILQIMSVLFWLFKQPKKIYKLRKIYFILVSLVFIMAIFTLSTDSEVTIAFLILVLFITPALALLYIIKLYNEHFDLNLKTSP